MESDDVIDNTQCPACCNGLVDGHCGTCGYSEDNDYDNIE